MNRLRSIVLRPSSLVVLLSLIAIAPLLQPGYFWGAHDARHDVYFLFQFDQSVQEGNWFPRWGPDWAFGYGYPFWIIYAPLSVMVGEAFHHFLGLGLGGKRQGSAGALHRPLGPRNVRLRPLLARAQRRAGGRGRLHGGPLSPGGRLRAGRGARVGGAGADSARALGVSVKPWSGHAFLRCWPPPWPTPVSGGRTT